MLTLSTDADNASGHCRPGAVRPIWQEEAPELREVKRFAQDHTARLLSEELKKRESGHQWTCNSILYLPTWGLGMGIDISHKIATPIITPT